MSFTMLFHLHVIIKRNFTLVLTVHMEETVFPLSLFPPHAQSWLALRVLKLTVIAARPLLTQLVMAVTISSQVPLPMILALNRTARSV